MMKDQEQELLELLLERERQRVSGAKTYTAEEMIQLTAELLHSDHN